MKNHLIVLTGNQGKFEEIASFLSDTHLSLEQIPLDLEEIQGVDALKIIHHKISQAQAAGYSNFILEDTSLYFSGLNRLPGPLIKWFLQELGAHGLYELASRMGNGAAMAETILAYVSHNKEVHIFSGATGGRIVEPRGTYGFGWASVFQPDNCLKTYAEMLYDEKKIWNQRIKALEAFKKFLDTLPI